MVHSLLRVKLIFEAYAHIKVSDGPALGVAINDEATINLFYLKQMRVL